MRWVEEQKRGWRRGKKGRGRRKVQADRRAGEWEQVASVEHARWVRTGAGGDAAPRAATGTGEAGGWEYFIKEVGGKYGWVWEWEAVQTMEMREDMYGMQ